jgi:hypothetical protein
MKSTEELLATLDVTLRKIKAGASGSVEWKIIAEALAKSAQFARLQHRHYLDNEGKL